MKKILYIDDDQDQILSFTRFIDKSKFQVVSETDALKALEVIKREKPDLILLDIIMNDMSGTEILQKMREDEEIRDIPVVFLTNSDPADVAKQADKLAALNVWEKTKVTPKLVAQKTDNYLRDTPKNGKKILLIDDDQFTTDLYGRKFERAGFEVFIERDPSKGAAKVEEVKPDLVLLDIIMPPMHGADVLKQIRKNPATKDTLVVVLSNSVDEPDDVAPFKDLGVKAMWSKVYDVPSTIALKCRELLGV